MGGSAPCFRILALVLSVFAFSCLWRTSMADPRATVAGLFCNNISSASGAIQANNFVPAMDNLSSVVDSQGFGTSLIGGDGPNAVYGLGQCMEDLSSVDCKLCFSEIRSQLPKCYPNTGGRLFLDGCFGRYDNYSFYNETLDKTDATVCSFAQNSSNAKLFTETLKYALGNVTAEAPNNKGYAAGFSSNSYTTVYALAQCWQNLDKGLCSTCLNAAASSIAKCTPATEGRALNAGCYVRYSSTLFWNTNSSSSSGSSDIVGILLGSILGGLVLIAGIVLWLTRARWRKPKQKSLSEYYGVELAAAIAQSNLNFRYEELKKACDNFNSSNKLGQGSFGTVYKGVLPDGKEVAIKRLFLNTRQWIDQFFNEVNLVNQVRHKNLVKLLGCSVDGPESMLVYEYYQNKSVDQFLFDADHGRHLDWQQRFDIIQGVAEGLSYLHEESETRIIHRDIKASNVLLDDKLKPKITDFGLARSFSEDQTHITTGIAGTVGYLAPEYLVHGHLTEKADVYSFGVLTLEIVSGKRSGNAVGSYEGHSLLAVVWNLHKANMVEKIIDECINEEGVKDEILHVVRVALLCTQADPQDRPMMSKVVELLRSSSSQEEFVLTDPPFLDVAAIEISEGESSYLLSGNAGLSQPNSLDVPMTAR